MRKYQKCNSSLLRYLRLSLQETFSSSYHPIIQLTRLIAPKISLSLSIFPRSETRFFSFSVVNSWNIQKKKKKYLLHLKKVILSKRTQQTTVECTPREVSSKLARELKGYNHRIYFLYLLEENLVY